MTAIEYAQKIIDTFRPGEKVISIEKSDKPLTCIIVCESGKKQDVSGYWAIQILRLKESNSTCTGLETPASKK